MVVPLLREHDKAPLLRVGVRGLERAATRLGNRRAGRSDVKLFLAVKPEWLAALVVLGHNSLLLKVPSIISRPVVSPHLSLPRVSLATVRYPSSRTWGGAQLGDPLERAGCMAAPDFQLGIVVPLAHPCHLVDQGEPPESFRRDVKSFLRCGLGHGAFLTGW